MLMNYNRCAAEIYQGHMVYSNTNRAVRMVTVIVIVVMESYSKSGKQK